MPLPPSSRLTHVLFFFRRTEDRRFRKPEPFEIVSDLNAKSYGQACPGQKFNFTTGAFNGSADISALARVLPEFHNSPYSQDEDCMFLPQILFRRVD